MLGVLFSCVRSCCVVLMSTLYCVHRRPTHFLRVKLCVVTVRDMTASQAYCKRLFSICGEMTVGKQNRMNCKQQNSSSSYQTQSRCASVGQIQSHFASVGLYYTQSHCETVGLYQTTCPVRAPGL